MTLVAVAALAGWMLWRHATRADAKPVAWRDLTAALGPVSFPRPYSHSFEKRRSLVDALRAAMPGRGDRLPPIDFSRDEAFLVTAGPRSSSGYDVRVVAVEDTGDRVLVTVREKTPSLGDPVTPGLTYPHRLIVFPRPGKPVRVHWQGRP